MPTYEFRAPDGTIIERSFRMSEVPASIPLSDGSGEAVRIISGGSGLIFKGSGFYITDYGKDGKKDQRPASTSGSGEGSSTPSDSGSKSESKGGESSGGSSSEKAAPAAAPKTANDSKSSSPASGATKPSSGE